MADELPEYNALGGKHCSTCAKFHVPKERPNKAHGYCVAHPPQVQAQFAAVQGMPKSHALIDPKNPPQAQMASVLLRVQAFCPEVASEDGCWEHVRRSD
ncbi:MAG TPA: hypothetical protein VKB67_02015 [Rhizomicrobium sp.]|nr:hypothetical protein [Rhizomicrobium sp.]